MAKNNTVVQQGIEARLYIQKEKRILTPASYHTQKSMPVTKLNNKVIRRKHRRIHLHVLG